MNCIANMEEDRRQKLFSLMIPGKEKYFFKTLQKWKTTRSKFPSELVVGDQTFYGDQVLSGFASAAYQQSRDLTIEKYRVSPHLTCMKNVVKLAEIEANRSNLKIEPMNRETFEMTLKKVRNDKAQDVYGISVEHFKHLSQKVKDIVLTVCNEMIKDYKAYSDPMLSISVSSFLYKQKNKPRQLTNSYRKISIGLTITKICDTYLEDTVKNLIRNNQSNLALVLV